MNVSLLSCHTYFAGLLFDALYQLWNGAIAPHDTFTVLYIQVREVTLLDSFIFPVKFVKLFLFSVLHDGLWAGTQSYELCGSFRRILDDRCCLCWIYTQNYNLLTVLSHPRINYVLKDVEWLRGKSRPVRQL